MLNSLATCSLVPRLSRGYGWAEPGNEAMPHARLANEQQLQLYIDLLDSSLTIAAKPTRRKRNDLTLKQKYELIKESEKNRTLTTRELAGIYMRVVKRRYTKF